MDLEGGKKKKKTKPTKQQQPENKCKNWSNYVLSVFISSTFSGFPNLSYSLQHALASSISPQVLLCY